MKQAPERFIQASVAALMAAVLFALYSTLIRVIFLWEYSAQLSQVKAYLSHCFALGTRIDLKTGTILCVLIVFFGIFFAAFNWQKQRLLFLIRLYTTAILTLALIILIANFYFYRTFATNFNESLFGFVGQAKALLPIFWKDYPIVILSIALLLNGIFLWKILAYLNTDRFERWIVRRRWVASSYVILFFIGYFFLMRGNFGFLPLGKDQTLFSPSPLINNAASNGVIALANAIFDHQIDSTPSPVTLAAGLANYNRYFGKHLPLSAFSLQTLFTLTPRNDFLKDHPPNVVFVQLESAGRHILLLDDPQTNDLLGDLRPYTQKDFFFTHFLSSGNSTTSSLINFIFASNLSSLFSVPVSEVPYQTSVAIPYKKAGYTTVFLTSGSLGWQNMGSVLLHQGFDKVIGDFDLTEQYPKISEQDWGVLDEYAFDYAFLLLQQAQREHKPIFIYINTVTNHTPYSLPTNYTPKPLHVPPSFAAERKMTPQKIQDMFETYQYTNSMLGDFIHEVEKSPLKNNTLIAASGDHNQHEFKENDTQQKEYALRQQVFFLLHVPSSYLPKIKIDTEQLASHRDIFPTLYHLSLSSARYINLGRDLANPSQESPFVFANNVQDILLPAGLVRLSEPKHIYPWENQKRLYVKKPRPLTRQEADLIERIKAYRKLQRWQIVWQYYQSKSTDNPGDHHK